MVLAWIFKVKIFVSMITNDWRTRCQSLRSVAGGYPDKSCCPRRYTHAQTHLNQMRSIVIPQKVYSYSHRDCSELPMKWFCLSRRNAWHMPSKFKLFPPLSCPCSCYRNRLLLVAGPCLLYEYPLCSDPISVAVLGFSYQIW